MVGAICNSEIGSLTHRINTKSVFQTVYRPVGKLSLCFFPQYRGGCGYGSESEGEEPGDSSVVLPQQMPGRGNIKSQQSAVRLTEVCTLHL